MPGTKAGGQKAAASNRKRYGDDFYYRIGAKGGSATVPTKGFGSNRELASVAGTVGGSISRRSGTASSTCTFCEKTGHSAYKCPIRFAILEEKRRQRARKRVEEEANEYERERLSKIASKYAVKRPW